MLWSDAPPVQPVLKAWLLRAWHRLWNIVHWMHRCLSWSRRFNRCFTSLFTRSPEAHRLAPKQGVGSSDNHRMHRCFRHWFFRCYWFLWVLSSCFALYGLFTSSLGSRNVHSIKPLVPLIALSFDHQNHSKWHKWCHVRYTNKFHDLLKNDCNPFI